jgi:coenzyme F420-reducing hydrogenase delta subunit
MNSWRFVLGFGDGPVTPDEIVDRFRDLATKYQNETDILAILIAARENALLDMIEARQDAERCLCIVGCSVNGECPIHGDGGHLPSRNKIAARASGLREVETNKEEIQMALLDHSAIDKVVAALESVVSRIQGVGSSVGGPQRRDLVDIGGKVDHQIAVLKAIRNDEPPPPEPTQQPA